MSAPVGPRTHWKVAAVLVPLALGGAWLVQDQGLLQRDPVRSAGVEELEANLREGEARLDPDRQRRLLVFIGDSRYRAAMAQLGRRKERETVKTMTIGEHEVDVFSLVGRGVYSFTEIEPHLQRVLDLRPDAIVIQPEMLSPHVKYHAVMAAPVAGSGRARHRANVTAQWGATRMPEPGPELALLAGLVRDAGRIGTVVLAAEVPPAELIASLAPRGYFDARRRLIAEQLRSGERDFLRKQPTYPDRQFSDYRHLTRPASGEWFPWVVGATLRRLEAGR